MAGGPDPSRKYNLSLFQTVKPKPPGMPYFSRFSRSGPFRRSPASLLEGVPRHRPGQLL